MKLISLVWGEYVRVDASKSSKVPREPFADRRIGNSPLDEKVGRS